MCEKFGFLIQTAYQRTVPEPLRKRRTVPTYRTRTKKAYRTSVPYFLAKMEAYRTAILGFHIFGSHFARIRSSGAYLRGALGHAPPPLGRQDSITSIE